MSDDDLGVLGATRDYLARKLSPGTQTFVHGGTNDVETHSEHERNAERLDEYETIYERGGPVASLIETRALMEMGTGADFVSDDDEEMNALHNGEAVSPTEWLHAQFDSLDNLLVQIAIDAYIYGDALAELVETRGENFGHVELVNPKTMDPYWDDHGRIHRWEQTIVNERGQEQTQPYPADQIAHFKLKTLGRHPLGISLIGQNYDEIKRFARNQEAIENYYRLHGFPKYHIKVGREGAGQIPDGDLRRVRSRFNNFNEKTNWTTGRDIEIEMLDNTNTGGAVEELAEHDLMILAAGFGVPEEMAGLGRGSTEATAKVRLQAFERNARAKQRMLADQFIEQVARPVLRKYSPFPDDIDLSLSFGDVVSDQTETAQWLGNFREYYTVDEVREKLGDGPAPEDEDLGPPAGAGQGGFPAGGLPAEAFAEGAEEEAPSEFPDEFGSGFGGE